MWMTGFPVAGFRRCDEVPHQRIERVWLLEVGRMAGAWKNYKAATRNRPLEPEVYLQTRLILVTNYQQHWKV